MAKIRSSAPIFVALIALCEATLVAGDATAADKPTSTAELQASGDRNDSDSACVPELKMLATVTDMLCLPMGDLIAEVNRRCQWQVKFYQTLER